MRHSEIERRIVGGGIFAKLKSSKVPLKRSFAGKNPFCFYGKDRLRKSHSVTEYDTAAFQCFTHAEMTGEKKMTTEKPGSEKSASGNPTQQTDIELTEEELGQVSGSGTGFAPSVNDLKEEAKMTTKRKPGGNVAIDGIT